MMSLKSNEGITVFDCSAELLLMTGSMRIFVSRSNTE